MKSTLLLPSLLFSLFCFVLFYGDQTTYQGRTQEAQPTSHCWEHFLVARVHFSYRSQRAVPKHSRSDNKEITETEQALCQMTNRMTGFRSVHAPSTPAKWPNLLCGPKTLQSRSITERQHTSIMFGTPNLHTVIQLQRE